MRAGYLAVVLAALGASAAAAGHDCDVPPELVTIGTPLAHSASRLAQGAPLTILAIGSSSTQGVGASSPAASYPSRLQDELKNRFPNHDIRVINRGIGGEDAPEEFDRLGREVADDRPDLVIWQVGTNAVLRRDDFEADNRLIERGVHLLKQHDVDVVLMDLQYAPRVLARQAYAEMERRIANIAKADRVGLFQRFAIMQSWDSAHRFEPGKMIGNDGLHMTDASYACLATDLAAALAANWRTYSASTGAHATVAAAAAPERRPPAPAAEGLDWP